MKKKRQVNFISSMMTHASVFDNGVRIGSTFIYYNIFGSQVQELVRDDGTIIPPGWYNLQIDETEPKLIILPRNKQ